MRETAAEYEYEKAKFDATNLLSGYKVDYPYTHDYKETKWMGVEHEYPEKQDTEWLDTPTKDASTFKYKGDKGVIQEAAEKDDVAIPPKSPLTTVDKSSSDNVEKSSSDNVEKSSSDNVEKSSSDNVEKSSSDNIENINHKVINKELTDSDSDKTKDGNRKENAGYVFKTTTQRRRTFIYSTDASIAAIKFTDGIRSDDMETTERSKTGNKTSDLLTRQVPKGLSKQSEKGGIYIGRGELATLCAGTILVFLLVLLLIYLVKRRRSRTLPAISEQMYKDYILSSKMAHRPPIPEPRDTKLSVHSEVHGSKNGDSCEYDYIQDELPVVNVHNVCDEAQGDDDDYMEYEDDIDSPDYVIPVGKRNQSFSVFHIPPILKEISDE